MYISCASTRSAKGQTIISDHNRPAIASPRKRGRRRIDQGPALDRGRLVDVLLTIAAGDGLAALNMRRVAAELGVSPRLIYHHVRDKQEMIDALLDAILSRHLPDLTGLGWEQRLRKAAEISWSVFARYRGSAAEMLARTANPVLLPHAAAARRLIMAALAEAGLTPERIEAVYMQLSILILGGLVLCESVPAARARIEKSVELGLQSLFDSVRRLSDPATSRDRPPQGHG
jgi:TetR/AcrR family tetracycline transcriptional repressor